MEITFFGLNDGIVQIIVAFGFMVLELYRRCHAL